MPSRNEPIDVFKLYDMTSGPDSCWKWNGTWGGPAREKQPYFMAGRKRMMAYRWVYELAHGVTLTRDQLILHSCDNGGDPIGCGNPAHLRVGTPQENMDDMVARERAGLSNFVVRAIRKLLEQGRPQQEIADLYGISREAVSAIATKRTHQSVE
jgi:hypothetical protein